MKNTTLNDVLKSKGSNRLHLLKSLEVEYSRLLFDKYNEKENIQRRIEIKQILNNFNRLTY
ncbi:MAG: hypothetical protein ACRCX2_09975 [Paraclostridium sp.]